jgi:hypothetical protein
MGKLAIPHIFFDAASDRSLRHRRRLRPDRL